jgi:hypothetical protein
MGYLNGELDDSLYILYVLKNLYGDYDKILGDLNIPSESIGLIEQSYRLGNRGTTLQALDAEYRRKLDNERAMLMAYFGYQISAALMNGTSVSPVFSEKSALDMLEKNGYLTPAQQKMLYHRWNYGDLPGDTSRILIPDNPSISGHIFRNASGHFVTDTPENRAILEDVANERSNYQGVDEFGSSVYTKTVEAGRQIWVEVRNGEIRNGGINETPRIFNLKP